MTYYRQIVAQIHRLGRKATVKVRNVTGENDFGNETDEYIADRTVIAFQSYPNRNTQVESSIGDRNRDRPIFIVPNTDDQPDPPDSDDHLVYNGQEYEVKAHTQYDTHVEFFGAPVIHDESGI